MRRGQTVNILLGRNTDRHITHHSEIESRLPGPDGELLNRVNDRRVDCLRVLESGLLDEARGCGVIVVDARVGLSHRLVVDRSIERMVVTEIVIGA